MCSVSVPAQQEYFPEVKHVVGGLKTAIPAGCAAYVRFIELAPRRFNRKNVACNTAQALLVVPVALGGLQMTLGIGRTTVGYSPKRKTLVLGLNPQSSANWDEGKRGARGGPKRIIAIRRQPDHVSRSYRTDLSVS